MPRELEGRLNGAGRKFAVVVSRYNDNITGKLLTGALQTLEQAGVADGDVLVAWIPGAYELPAAAEKVAASGSYDAVLCLGAVIRGETTHDQHINRAVSNALAEISVRRRLPVSFGLLTCENMEQALQRAGGTVGNKGVECAEAALRMVDLFAQLDGESTN